MTIKFKRGDLVVHSQTDIYKGSFNWPGLIRTIDCQPNAICLVLSQTMNVVDVLSNNQIMHDAVDVFIKIE